MQNHIHQIDFDWDRGWDLSIIEKNAPPKAVCAILHGAVWGWTKSYEVKYFSQDVGIDEPRFMSEPVNKYQICKRKKFKLKPKQ